YAGPMICTTRGAKRARMLASPKRFSTVYPPTTARIPSTRPDGTECTTRRDVGRATRRDSPPTRGGRRPECRAGRMLAAVVRRTTPKWHQYAERSRHRILWRGSITLPFTGGGPSDRRERGRRQVKRRVLRHCWFLAHSVGHSWPVLCHGVSRGHHPRTFPPSSAETEPKRPRGD